jgi:hypothetical protein
MKSTLWIVVAFVIGSCHLARPEPPEPGCFDNALVSCEACTDRGCTWCSEGPNAADGFCCQASARCTKQITSKPQCPVIPSCEQAIVNSCGECLGRGCAWCPGESRCRARGDDGTFPVCEGRVSGEASCPAQASTGESP